MKSYAAGTTVPVERSKAELDSLLGKHGATRRGIMSDEILGVAFVAFTLRQRSYQLEIPLPKGDEFPDVRKSFIGKDQPRGWPGWTTERRMEWAQKVIAQKTRERWRCMVLLVKAKLEMCALGLSSPEREFLSDLVLSDGRRMHMAIESAITNGKMPLLPAASGSQP